MTALKVLLLAAVLGAALLVGLHAPLQGAKWQSAIESFQSSEFQQASAVVERSLLQATECCSLSDCSCSVSMNGVLPSCGGLQQRTENGSCIAQPSAVSSSQCASSSCQCSSASQEAPVCTNNCGTCWAGTVEASYQYQGFRLPFQPIQGKPCPFGQSSSQCLETIESEWPDESIFSVYFPSSRPEAATLEQPKVKLYEGALTTSLVFSLLAAIPMGLLSLYGLFS